MKKSKLNAAKLMLQKERISNLLQSEMEQVLGGDDSILSYGCNITHTCTKGDICKATRKGIELAKQTAALTTFQV